MTVTLNLTPEIEAGLLVHAAGSGKSLEDYLLSVVEGAAKQESASDGKSAREEAVRQMLEFGEKYRLNFEGPITRQLLHEGHRL